MANKDDCPQSLCSDGSLPISFNKKRHTIVATVNNAISKSWRIRDRMKTVSVALVVCLNVGVDPPDVFKITPCARLECWIDPSSVSPQKALEMIGINLQRQYERWQPRARYKQSLDPTVEDIKKLCSSLRRNAKEERVLFHYNGHGVPRPTVNGEVWVFNRTYTQYIPLSIYDLQTWMGAPSIYVYDCSNAGIIVNSFNQFAEQHERELDQVTGTLSTGTVPSSATIAGGGGNVNRASPNDAVSSSPNGAATISSSNTTGGVSAGGQSSIQLHHHQQSYRNCIQMAACTATQILPMNPQLPADLFTACLTTPIKIGLKWFTLQQSASLLPKLSSNFLERIPGRLNDRRTMLGELNWIFTAITDTIAWNTMPRELFQKLFRQDLLVASLFRNYLLADRIMRSYDCTPITCPELPSAHRHPMWSAWDLCVDLALQQLPNMLENGYEYENLTFFEDQLSAFHVWLERGSQTRTPPLQLPIVLQVLLSQVHRIRALELLGKFLDLGPWAVHTALSVGIFPYVLKLLQASSKELRPLLVFIWAKILAVDSTCQVDLVCDKGHKYFLSVLQDTTIEHEYRTMAAFILASIVHNFPLGQANCLQGSMVSICLVHICDYDSMLRQWLAICLGNLWQNYDKARWSGVRDLAHEKLYPLLQDPIPDVRAAAVYALGTFISSVTNHKDRTEHANNIDRSIAMTMLTTVGNDISPMVRMELIAALQWMVILFESQFVSVFLQEPTMGIGNLPAAAAAAIHLPSSHPTALPHPPSSSSTTLQHHHPHHTHSLERNINIKRVSSSSSIANMSGSGSLINFHPGTTTFIGFGSIYMKLWQGLIQLCRDPYPDVAQMATKVIDYIVNQAVDLISAKEATKENFTICSLSLPPSPNTRKCYLGESPPHHINHVMTGSGGKQSPVTVIAAVTNALTTTLDDTNTTNVGNINNKGRHGSRSSTPTSNHHHSTTTRSRRNSKTQPHPTEDTTVSSGFATGDTHHQSSPPPPQPQSNVVSNPMNTSINSTGGGANEYQQKAIVGTAFLHWAVGQFSSASTLKTEKYDCHAPEELERIIRYQRNDEIRRIGREQKIHAAHKRLETQYWIGRTQFPPHIIKLHPYEPQIAVAYKNKITVNDMQRNVIQSYIPQSIQLQNNKSPPYHSIVGHMVMNGGTVSQSRVTAVDFVNAHDKTLILAGYEDGIIRIWRPSDIAKDSKLITAWQAIGDVTRSKFSVNVSSSIYGLVMAWQQRSQTCAIASGNDPSSIRCWNVETELKICDIRTGTDSPIIVLTTGLNEILAAGCLDGSVRLYDKRLPPSDAKVMTFRESTTAILSVCLRDDCERLITGCSQGNVRIFDVRKNASMCSWTVDGEVTAMAIHSAADVIAGGTNCITTYTLDGQPLSTIRPHGFMGPRISNTTCLSFHPWKVNLAAGFVDLTVAVYVTDSKRN